MNFLTVTDDKVLQMSSTKVPDIAIDECLVKVSAIGVNRADILQKEGKYPPPKGESLILGLEVSGEVVKCGNAVSARKVGERVFGLVPGGAYAEFVKVKACHLFPLPKSFSHQQGAATAEVFLTAYQSLFSIAKLQANESVLIHAGASGVGTAAIQLAKAKGCHVSVTVSSEEKALACKNLGADLIINYRKEDFVKVVKEKYPQGYDVIIDVVSGDYINKNINIAALDCRIVILAMLGGRFAESIDCAKMLLKRITISASTLRNRPDDYKTALIENFTKDFYLGLEKQRITPVIHQVFTWHDANDAHKLMQENQNIGKIILSVES